MNAILKFYIIKADGTTEAEAFSAATHLGVNFSFLVLEDKKFNLNVDELKLHAFNIMEDNCGMKPDEEEIRSKLNSFMDLLARLVNLFIPTLNLHLPTFETFDYLINFDYQDQGLGIATKIILK